VNGAIDRNGGHAEWPRHAHAQLAIGEARVVCVGTAPVRWLHVAPAGASAAEQDSRAALDWEILDIEAGEPQVYAATSEVFVSQMLNLDLIGAIAFDKGCYTGQEIIARAHYRGRMKRRMQRFRTAPAVALQPGDRGRLRDGREFQVVRSVVTTDATEFLAVTAAADEGSSNPEQLPLPYALPA
jgi:folate-binding protein YgfZ